jgi:superfamily II DNA or RNA helicase
MKQIPVTHTIADWDQTNLTLLEFEQKLVPHRLDAVKDKIRPGTIIYTYYLEGVEDVATDYVRSLGFSVAKYTGNENAKVRERIQKKFVRGDIDVLIGSQAMAVGVDGLQERCNRMIFLSLPWTYAAYEQIIGRVYRTGSKFESVEVFIPQVLTTSHKTTYDTFRWSLLRDKRTLAECATDGVVPNVISLNRNAVLEMVRKEMVQEGKSAKGVGAP